MYGLFKRKRVTSHARKRSEYGNSPLDFERRCCFKEQIEHIGKGTKDGLKLKCIVVKPQSFNSMPNDACRH